MALAIPSCASRAGAPVRRPALVYTLSAFVALWEEIDRRFAACGLALHPQKTKLVYCKDTNRKGEHGCVCVPRVCCGSGR